MRRCNWCSRWFRSKQATKAHLRWCQDWQRHKRDNRPAPVLLDVHKCSVCWQGPTHDGRPATMEELASVGFVCTACGVDPRSHGGAWVKVGVRSASGGISHVA